MRVLVIDEWLPWPLETGKKIRSFNLMSRLAQRHNIFYQAYLKLPQETDKVRALENLDIQVIPVEDIRTKKWTFWFYFEVILNFLSTKPFSTVYHIKNVFAIKMTETIRRIKPDLVHCEWTNLAPFLENVENIPTIIAAHNVESDIWKRLAENSPNLFFRLLGRHQAKKIERLEKKWYPHVDHCIAVSPEDQRVIASYGAQVSLVENGVDVRYYSRVKDCNIDKNRLIFVASFDTLSNQDGVDFFIRKIFPIIKRRNPEVSFWLVGKSPTEKMKAYAKEDSQVHVTGTVPDVRDYISKASICVVPLRIGGGSRLKIIEAMAMKKPVVSTTIGAEGLKVKDGDNILLADEPEKFATKVLELLSNPERKRSLGRLGCQLVRLNYDWESLAHKQSDIWESQLKNYK